jgi:hypothetical protein
MNPFELNRLASDVLKFFKEVTGKELNAKDETPNIAYFADRGWVLKDFEAIIRFYWQDRKQKEFLLQPGRLNIRSIFNTSQPQIVSDILSDIQWMEKKKERDVADYNSGNKNKEGFLWDAEQKRWRAQDGAKSSLELQLACGGRFAVLMVFDGKNKKWMKTNLDVLREHYSACNQCQQKTGGVSTK